jgi:hypothetical protein
MTTVDQQMDGIKRSRRSVLLAAYFSLPLLLHWVPDTLAGPPTPPTCPPTSHLGCLQSSKREEERREIRCEGGRDRCRLRERGEERGGRTSPAYALPPFSAGRRRVARERRGSGAASRLFRFSGENERWGSGRLNCMWGHHWPGRLAIANLLFRRLWTW